MHYFICNLYLFISIMFGGEMSTHVFHYISPREETPVGMTNHTQRLRERYLSFVAARIITFAPKVVGMSYGAVV